MDIGTLNVFLIPIAVVAYPLLMWWRGVRCGAGWMVPLVNAIGFWSLAGVCYAVQNTSSSSPWWPCVDGLVLWGVLAWMAFFSIVGIRPRDGSGDAIRGRYRVFLIAILASSLIPMSRWFIVRRGLSLRDQKVTNSVAPALCEDSSEDN